MTPSASVFCRVALTPLAASAVTWSAKKEFLAGLIGFCVFVARLWRVRHDDGHQRRISTAPCRARSYSSLRRPMRPRQVVLVRASVVVGALADGQRTAPELTSGDACLIADIGGRPTNSSDFRARRFAVFLAFAQFGVIGVPELWALAASRFRSRA
jgi:hypothetical protein